MTILSHIYHNREILFLRILRQITKWRRYVCHFYFLLSALFLSFFVGFSFQFLRQSASLWHQICLPPIRLQMFRPPVHIHLALQGEREPANVTNERLFRAVLLSKVHLDRPAIAEREGTHPTRDRPVVVMHRPQVGQLGTLRLEDPRAADGVALVLVLAAVEFALVDVVVVLEAERLDAVLAGEGHPRVGAVGVVFLEAFLVGETLVAGVAHQLEVVQFVALSVEVGYLVFSDALGVPVQGLEELQVQVLAGVQETLHFLIFYHNLRREGIVKREDANANIFTFSLKYRSVSIR